MGGGGGGGSLPGADERSLGERVEGVLRVSARDLAGVCQVAAADARGVGARIAAAGELQQHAQFGLFERGRERGQGLNLASDNRYYVNFCGGLKKRARPHAELGPGLWEET